MADTSEIPTHDEKYATVGEIFTELSIPAIQSLEVKLRSNAATKRSDLRLLVGESYRDLLTTADTIVSMRGLAVVLRKQLTTFITACDSVPVSRKVDNLKTFPSAHQEAQEEHTLCFIGEVRSLLIHFIRLNQLVLAATCYAVARLASGAISKQKAGMKTRLNQARMILMKSINKCTDIQVFSSSFAIMESAMPSACLKYFLSLQISNLSRCLTLHELSISTLRMLDSTREFARLQETFEDLSKKTLLSSLKCCPELDYNRLEKSLGENIREYKPYLRSEVLSMSMIEGHVHEWMASSSDQLRAIAARILETESDIAMIIKMRKDVRNELDEASQIGLFRLMEPAIEARLSKLLDVSLSTLRETKTHISRVLDRIDAVEPLWSSRIPWSRGTLANFKHITRKTIRGDMNSFSIFERAYLPIKETIDTNLTILQKSKEQNEHRSKYVIDLQTCYNDLLDFLVEEARASRSRDRMVCVLRMILYIARTAPVDDVATPSTVDFFSTLIEPPIFVINDQDYSSTFENGLPVMPSPGTAKFLIDISAATAELGIDIVGTHERAAIRALVTQILRDVLHGQDLYHDRHTSTDHKGSGGNDTFQTLPCPPNGEKSQVLSRNGHPDSDELKNNSKGEADSSIPTQSDHDERSGTANGQSDATDHEGSAGKFAHDPRAAIKSQSYFDLEFLKGLFQLQDMDGLESLARDIPSRELLDLAIQKSINKNRVLHGTILD